MKQEYPRMVYKTREDYTIVNILDEEEAALKNGYGSFEIMVLGRDPEDLIKKEEKKIEALKKQKKVFKPHEGDNIADMEGKFEKETGKKAFWKGKKTSAFMNWLKKE